MEMLALCVSENRRERERQAIFSSPAPVPNKTGELVNNISLSFSFLFPSICALFLSKETLVVFFFVVFNDRDCAVLGCGVEMDVEARSC